MVKEIKKAIQGIEQEIKDMMDSRDILPAIYRGNGESEEHKAEDEKYYFLKTCLIALQEKLEREENKPLDIEQLKSSLDKNGSFPVWYEYADTGVEPEIVTKITYDSDRECYFIYFTAGSFFIFSKHTKIYKYKPKGESDEYSKSH